MPDPYVGSIEPPIAIVVSITRAVALPATAAHLGRFLPRLGPLVTTRAAPLFFVCTHMELNRGLVDLYLGRVASYPRAMATTKRSVLPDDTEWKATESAREQAVAGQGRPRNARPVFPMIEPHVASNYCLLPRLAAESPHDKHRRSLNPVPAREPARVQCSSCGCDRSGSIQHGRVCPHPAGLRSRPVRQELEGDRVASSEENAGHGPSTHDFKSMSSVSQCRCHRLLVGQPLSRA